MGDSVTKLTHEPELAAYYSVLAEAAIQGNRLANEVSEHEVAELLRRRGTIPTPVAIDAWYEEAEARRRAARDR